MAVWGYGGMGVGLGSDQGDIGGALEDIAWRDVIPGSFIEDCDSPPGSCVCVRARARAYVCVCMRARANVLICVCACIWVCG
jgi:hypothetical protein